ncbi:MAG: hypothetical protein Q4C71_03800 [Microbacteriaceae bacterium]|nr:hypothetical protein [Microbacteriaceae bacterium]
MATKVATQPVSQNYTGHFCFAELLAAGFSLYYFHSLANPAGLGSETFYQVYLWAGLAAIGLCYVWSLISASRAKYFAGAHVFKTALFLPGIMLLQYAYNTDWMRLIVLAIAVVYLWTKQRGYVFVKPDESKLA